MRAASGSGTAAACCWALLACLLLNATSAAPPEPVTSASIESSHGKSPLLDRDFVVAIPTCTTRLPLLNAGRTWRNGMRSFITLNSTTDARELTRNSTQFQETYGYWDADDRKTGTWRAYYTGDTRAGLTPLLAHQHFGDSYKWLLYADDDTIFFMPGVRKLLSSLDHNLPFIITDNIWYKSDHPNPMAPRCLPCGYNLSQVVTPSSYMPRPGCPFCTREMACGVYAIKDVCSSSQQAAAPVSEAAIAGLVRSLSEEYNSAAKFSVAGLWQNMARSMQRRFQVAAAAAKAEKAAAALAAEQGKQQGDGGNSSSSDAAGGGTAASTQAAAAGAAGAGGAADKSLRARVRRLMQQGTSAVVSAARGVLVGPAGSAGARRRRRPNPGTYSGGPYPREGQFLPDGFCVSHDSRMHTAPHPDCNLRSSTAHGGSGMLISVGLLRHIDIAHATDHMLTLRNCGGGDCLFIRTMWDLGFAVTDPGSPLSHNASDYVRYTHFYDSPKVRKSGQLRLMRPDEALLQHPEDCDGPCRWAVENMVSAHVSMRRFRFMNLTAAAIQQRVLTHMQAQVKLRSLSPIRQQQQQGDARNASSSVQATMAKKPSR